MAFNHYARINKIIENNNVKYYEKLTGNFKTQKWNGEYNYYQNKYYLLDENFNRIKFGVFYNTDIIDKFKLLEIKK